MQINRWVCFHHTFMICTDFNLHHLITLACFQILLTHGEACHDDDDDDDDGTEWRG